MTWFLYALDAVIVGTYLAVVLGRIQPDWFDWANAVCGPALLVTSLALFGWQPILLLTITFTIAGWIGGLKGLRHA